MLNNMCILYAFLRYFIKNKVQPSTLCFYFEGQWDCPSISCIRPSRLAEPTNRAQISTFGPCPNHRHHIIDIHFYECSNALHLKKERWFPGLMCISFSKKARGTSTVFCQNRSSISSCFRSVLRRHGHEKPGEVSKLMQSKPKPMLPDTVLFIVESWVIIKLILVYCKCFEGKFVFLFLYRKLGVLRQRSQNSSESKKEVISSGFDKFKFIFPTTAAFP